MFNINMVNREMRCCYFVVFICFFFIASEASAVVSFPNNWKQAIIAIPGESKARHVSIPVKLNKRDSNTCTAYLIRHSTKGVVDNEGWYIVDQNEKVITDKVIYEKLSLSATVAYAFMKKDIVDDLAYWDSTFSKALTGMTAYHSGKFVVETGAKIEGLIARLYLTKTGGKITALSKSGHKQLLKEIRKKALNEIKNEMIKSAGGKKLKPVEFVDSFKEKSQQYSILMVTNAKGKIGYCRRLSHSITTWDYDTAKDFYTSWQGGVVEGAVYMNFWNDLTEAGWKETVKMISLNFVDGATGLPVKDIWETGEFFSKLSTKSDTSIARAFANLDLNQNKYMHAFAYWDQYYDTNLIGSGSKIIYSTILYQHAANKSASFAVKTVNSKWTTINYYAEDNNQQKNYDFSTESASLIMMIEDVDIGDSIYVVFRIKFNGKDYLRNCSSNNYECYSDKPYKNAFALSSEHIGTSYDLSYNGITKETYPFIFKIKIIKQLKHGYQFSVYAAPR